MTRPLVLGADGKPAMSFKHDAMARLQGRLAPVISAAKAAGVTVEDAFSAYVLAIAGQNPAMARTTLDAIEATIAQLAARHPAPEAGVERPAFERRNADGATACRIWADGRSEGLPGAVTVNRIPLMLSEARARGGGTE
jgi:hypothetical protein